MTSIIDMDRQTLINRTQKLISRLPEDKLQQVVDFLQFLPWKYEEELLTKGVAELNKESKGFDFLHEEEDL